MTAYHDHVIPFDAHQRRRRHREVADHALAARAAARGLRVSRDKFGNYYLHLPQEEICARVARGELDVMDPGLVLCMATRSDVEFYFATHPPLGHRLLNFGEVYTQIMRGPLVRP